MTKFTHIYIYVCVCFFLSFYLYTYDYNRLFRILANRQAAARSKDKKAKYLLDLENKVEYLKMESYGSSVWIRQLEVRDITLPTIDLLVSCLNGSLYKKFC